MQPNQSSVNSVKNVSSCYPGRRKMYLAAVATYFGSVAMGTVLGFSNPALHDMEKEHSEINPTDSESSWIGSIMALGALVGALITGPVTDKFGLQPTLVFSVVPFTAGWLCIAYAKDVLGLLFGRFITGACCGLVSLSVPVYLAEISTPKRRGIIGSGFQTMVVIGILVTFVVGGSISWVYLALFSAIFPIIMSAMMLFMPETPRFLISKGRQLEAAKSVYFLQGETVDLEESCRELQDNFDTQPKGKVSPREMLKPYIMKPVLICLMIMFFQQWCGINGIMFYANVLFQKSGYDKLDPNDSSIILGAAQVIGTVLGAIIIDKLGRKKLLLISSSFMILGMTILAVLFGIAQHKDDSFLTSNGWVELMGLSIYVLAFAVGYGPIPWVIMSELIPPRVKGPASSLATFFNWMNAFLVTNQFKPMINGMDYGAYIFYDIVCVLGFVFVVICLPETKGKSLDDIQALFSSGFVNEADQSQDVAGSVNSDYDRVNVRRFP